MANTLMFEVGVKEAGTQISDLEKRLKELVANYGTMKIAVEISNLNTFVNALKSIGNGEQLKPLLDRIQTLQNRLGALGDKGQYFDMLRGNAAAAAKEVERAEKYLVAMQKTGNSGFIASAKDSLQRAQVEATRANEMLASAMERVAKEEQNTSATSSDLRTKIDAVAQSVSDLQAKLGNGIHINLDTSKFGPLTEQIQNLAGETSGLITQLKTLSQVQSQPANDEAIKTQTKDVENLAKAKDKLTESNKKAADSQASDESTNKVTNTYERYKRLLYEIENQMAAIGKIQLFGEQSGFSPTILKKAVDEFEKLKTVVDATINGKPIAEGLTIPMTPEQLSQFVAQFSLLKVAYKDIVKEADRYNKQNERDFVNAQKSVQSEIDKTVAKLRLLDESISKGRASGRDMSVLTDTRNKLESQLNVLRNMTSADFADPQIVARRISDIRQLRKEISDTASAEQRFKSAQESGYNAVSTKIADVNIKIAKYRQSLLDAVNTPISTSSLDAQKRNVEDLLRLLEQIRVNKGITDDGRTMREVMREYGQYIKQADYAMSNLNKQVAAHKKNAQKDPSLESQKEYASLVKQIARMQKSEIKASNLGIDTSELRRQIELLERYRQDLERLVSFKGNHNGFTIFDFRDASYTNSRASGSIERQRVEVAYQTEKANRAAAQAASQLTLEEQRLAQAMSKTTDSAKGQSQVLSDLKMMATQYLGVWGAQGFLHKIIETGGQLEQQRLSLSAILGDVEKANTLFGQVKELAIRSPFGVVQIDQMTKQLAAYSFEYEELFDWTKRLADISAATGTEVSRLALALGHVRSEGALSGYTLRQFAMANVPVLRMLSENLGISTKEVRERVKKKEISADDVQEILKQLTDEGGMFYNAQETMSEALNAKYKNLRDAFDIMYGEIAEGGVGDALKEIAVVLTQGAKEWERFGKDILMVAAATGIGKSAIYLYNKALGEGTAASLKNISTAQNQVNSYYRLAKAAGMITSAEYKSLVAKDQSAASALRVAIATNKLTAAELQRAVMLGKVRKEVALAAVANTEYESTIRSTAVMSKWSKGIFLLKEGFRAATVAVRGFFASLWPLLALSAVFDLANRASSQKDAAQEAAEGAAKATNKYQDLQAMTERLGSSHGKANDQLEKNVKSMKDALISVGEYTEELKKQVDAVESLSEKYDILHAAMKKVSEQASDRQSRKQALIEEGLSAGGGTAWNPINWFRDNALQDAKDIDDYTRDLYLALDRNDRVLREGFKKILETSGKWQEKFDKKSAKDIFMSLKDSIQDEVLYELRFEQWASSSLKEAGRALGDIMYGFNSERANASKYSYQGAINELKGHQEELAKAFEDAFRIDYPDIDLSEADDTQKIIFEKWLDTTIANLEDVKEAGKKAINEMVIEGTIGVRLNYSLDNENFLDFMNKFREKSPLAYFEWQQHGRDIHASAEDQRKSAESYSRTFSGASQSNIGNEAKKKIKELQAERKNLVAFQKSIVYKTNEEEKNRADERLKAIDEETKRLKQAQKDYNQYGDPDKSRRSKTEDMEAKRLREVVKLYKDAYDWYGKYEKQVGEGSALAKVKEQFQPLFDQFEAQFKQKLSLDSIPLYKDNLTALLDEAQKLYETPKHRNSYMVEAIKTIRDAINNVDFEEAQRKIDEYASKVQIELDNLTRSWEMFNSVRDSTGNIDLAVKLSGAGYQEGETINLADALRKKIEGDFAAAGAVAIPFDINFSDEDIFNRISAAMPEKTQEQIKGTVEEYKKWRDLQRDVYKQGITTISQLLGSAQDYETVVGKINTSLATQKETIDSMAKPDGMKDDEWAAVKARAKDLADAKAQNDIFKLSTEYINLMNHSLGMASESIKTAAEACKNELGKNLKDNIITAEQYADEMAKIEKIMSDFKANGLFGRNSDLNSFIKGGTQGLVSRYTDQLAARRTELANQGKSKEEIENDEVVKRLKELKSGLEDFANGLNSIASYIDFATSILQGFGDAAKNLSEMFDALGNESSANTWSDISDNIGAITSGLQSLSSGMKAGANGDIGGAISGVVGAVTSPITAFAQLHDKGIQREIEAIQDNVDALEANTNSIRAARERTLGYDTGALRRAMSELYEDTTKTTAMQEYYNASTNKTGYAAELENLKEMRENYLEMYDKENSKKKSSQDALDEYKKKIAELDEQIMYFVEDLAKELWGIDFKAWASQISDALWTAFENGEEALDAFHDTAKDIIADVAKRMMNIHLIEPVFQKLEEELFGKIDASGKRIGGAAYNYDTGEFNENETLKILGKFFGEDGEFAKVIDSAESFYNMAQEATGFKFSSDEKKSSGTTNTIKSITENTADLLASYINSIRADVSVDRALASQYFPMFHAAITSGNASLVNIENHTAAIMRSNETIANGITEMQSDIRGLKNKTWRVPVA